MNEKEIRYKNKQILAECDRHNCRLKDKIRRENKNKMGDEIERNLWQLRRDNYPGLRGRLFYISEEVWNRIFKGKKK